MKFIALDIATHTGFAIGDGTTDNTVFGTKSFSAHTHDTAVMGRKFAESFAALTVVLAGIFEADTINAAMRDGISAAPITRHRLAAGAYQHTADASDAMDDIRKAQAQLDGAFPAPRIETVIIGQGGGVNGGSGHTIDPNADHNACMARKVPNWKAV